MTLREELIGMWSADSMYGPAAQSDEVLIFKADGTGRFEIINLLLCSADLFHWEISQFGHLTLHGFKRLEPDDTARFVIESPSEFNFTAIRYQIQEEDTKSGKRMRVLRLTLYEYVSDHYGFVRNDLTGLEEPDFQLR